jgi:predicted membrane channel-forming protein YqfA (hemolysin III family)
MRPSRIVLFLWLALIAVLLLVELSEISHLFTLPVQSWIGDPLAFVFALVFTTVLALVGAIFIGIYVSQRMLSPSGFTPFEEEMLKMRGDLRDLKASVEQLKRKGEPPLAGESNPEPTEEAP